MSVKPFLVLFFVALSLVSTAQNETRKAAAFLSAADFSAYNRYQKKSIISFIENSVGSGKLNVYRSPNFEKKLSYKDYKLIGATINKEDTQFFEVYMLISPPTDTVYLNPRKYLGFTIDYSKNLFVLNFDSLRSAYFRLNEVKEVLGSKHNTFISIAKSSFYKNSNNEGVFVDSALKKNGETVFHKLALSLYNLGIKQKVSTYKSIDLIEVYTKAEIKNKGSFTIYKHIQNDENPDDIYDLIEVATTTLFQPQRISNIIAYDKWETKDNNDLTLSLLAFAPGYKPIVAGETLRLIRELFIVSANDFEQQMENKFLYGYLSHVFEFVIHERGDKEID